MIAKHTTMVTTPHALIITIPWEEVAGTLRPLANRRGRKLSAKTILRFVEEGRLAHAKGRTRRVGSLAEI